MDLQAGPSTGRTKLVLHNGEELADPGSPGVQRCGSPAPASIGVLGFPLGSDRWPLPSSTQTEAVAPLVPATVEDVPIRTSIRYRIGGFRLVHSTGSVGPRPRGPLSCVFFVFPLGSIYRQSKSTS